MSSCLRDVETESRAMIGIAQSHVDSKETNKKFQHYNLFYLTLEPAFFLLLLYTFMEFLECNNNKSYHLLRITVVRYCSKYLVYSYVNPFNPHKNPRRWVLLYHFRDEEMEA